MKTSIKIIHWLPRIICILAILFVSMFAFDSFDSRLTIWQQIGAFLIHLIPSYILIGLLIVAWRWELVGGIIFAVIGFATSPFVFYHNYGLNHSIGVSLHIIFMITVPFILIGALFIICYYMKKKDI